VAIVAVILCVALNLPLGTLVRFLAFYPVVLLSAWVGGPIAGVITALMLAAATAYFWLPPLYSLAVSDQRDAIALFVFLAVGLISCFAVGNRRPREQAPIQGSDERLHAVAEALRTAEVLISVHKRDETFKDPRVTSCVWIAPSEGTACATCGQPIKTGDIAYEIAAAGHDMCIDRTCYQRLMAIVEHGSLRVF